MRYAITIGNIPAIVLRIGPRIKAGTLFYIVDWSLLSNGASEQLAPMLDCQPPASTSGEKCFSANLPMFYSSPADGPDHLYERQ